MRIANKLEMEAVVEYLYALEGEMVCWSLEYPQASSFLLKKCLRLGLEPRETARLGGWVDGVYTTWVIKAKGDLVIRNKEAAADWVVSKAAAWSVERKRVNKEMRDRVLHEARGMKEVTQVEKLDVLYKYKQWLRALPTRGREQWKEQEFEVKVMTGTPLERATLVNFAKSRGVRVGVRKREAWLVVVALDKVERDRTRLLEFGEMEVGEVFELPMKQLEIRQVEKAVERFNSKYKDRRLVLDINQGFFVRRVV